MISSKTDTIHFYVNDTRVIQSIKAQKLSFCSIEKKKLPTANHSVLKIRFNFKSQLKLTQKHDHLSADCIMINIDKDITDITSSERSLIYCRKRVGLKREN